MMLLMNVPVDETMVQQPVGVVKPNLFDDYKHGQFQKDVMECGQFSDWSESSGTHCTVAQQSQRDAHQELIDQHRSYHLH